MRRAGWAVGTVALVILIGTLGFHLIENRGWVDAFYFESMLATGQGPPFVLNSDAGKVFASVMGFVSIGSVVTTIVVVLMPILGQLWREGVERAEAKARSLELSVEHRMLRLEEELRLHRHRPNDDSGPPAPP